VQQLLLSTQTDERLARLSAGGQAAAFTVLVERHRRSLYRVALNLVSVGEADDVMQQSLLQAWAALQSGAEIRHVRGWLHQIVRHVAIRSRATPLPHVALDAEAAAAVSLRPDPEMSLRMRETLAGVAELPAKQRLALLRCAVQGESQAAVATELGTTETGVRQLLYRARSSLRAAATALLPFPIAQWAAGSLSATAGFGAAGGLAGSADLGTASKLAAAVAAVAVGGGATVAVEQHERAKPSAARAAAVRTASASQGATAAGRPARSGTTTVSLVGASASVPRRPGRAQARTASQRARSRDDRVRTKDPKDDASPRQPSSQKQTEPVAQQQSQPQTAQSGPSQPQNQPSGENGWGAGARQQAGATAGGGGASQPGQRPGGAAPSMN
jgi:RNA polymerase sigma factor (sigma-70 family)